MGKSDLVTIIIPTLNAKAFLRQVLEAIEKNTKWPYEVIIVENLSTDGTIEYLKNLDLDINGQVIYNQINMGFGVANNQAAKLAKGSFLCFLNNDTIPTKGWLTAMMGVFEEEDAVGVVGAKLLHPGTGLIQHAGVVEMRDGRPDHMYFKKHADYPPANIRKQYFAVTFACAVVPKGLFEDIGGFDEGYWCGWEDMAMCQEIHKKGQRVYYEPKAVVYHYESRTEGRYKRESHNFNRYMAQYILNKEE